ncbi:hypothetical protein [Nonomuraea roseoviolacea]|uniref:Uncharacterized protein n=1 Tax=Nonomuraea roseoviolacea subsp. carminata TaxID=160689 RepID=A0ABT1JY08_9ACTN|nr:hypothetical protein [Nonomuraea roseoviolacea]MCP2346302.1 hypothetical protein [Nonomuraea roseoviolacea subsp. carminata]
MSVLDGLAAPDLAELRLELLLTAALHHEAERLTALRDEAGRTAAD